MICKAFECANKLSASENYLISHGSNDDLKNMNEMISQRICPHSFLFFFVFFFKFETNYFIMNFELQAKD